MRPPPRPSAYAVTTSIFGSEVVVLTGQACNRFVFSGADNGFSYQQPKAVARLLGKNSLFELSGSQHKLITDAIVEFLKPESIQRFANKMDSLVQEQLIKELDGKDSVQIVELMKKISFDVSCSILFGLQDGKEKNILFLVFNRSERNVGNSADCSGTMYYKALKARTRLCKRLLKLVDIKRRRMEESIVDPNENFISSLLNVREKKGKQLQEEAILDICLSLIMASHDTAAILMTLFIRHLARDAEVHNKVLEEQIEVAKAKKGSDGVITWRQIHMMKYTWTVAQELMRIYPPLFRSFRFTTRDISFGGFDIPKAWQLLWLAASTHMDKNIFKDLNKFDPARFEDSLTIHLPTIWSRPKDLPWSRICKDPIHAGNPSFHNKTSMGTDDA